MEYLLLRVPTHLALKSRERRIHLTCDAKVKSDILNGGFMIHLQKWNEIEVLSQNKFHRFPVPAPAPPLTGI
jgi:hypothetical protein